VNILHERELGLIQAQIDQMRELDVFSELADLEYLAKLEAKAAQAAEAISVAGKSPKGLLASLDDGLTRLLAFTIDFDKKVKAFRDGFALDPPYSQLELKEGLGLLGSLWRDFENDLSSVDENFVELDWSEDESAGGKVFCKFLQSYDHFKNGDTPSLVLSEDLKNYLADPAKFKQSCLSELHQAKEEVEQLLVKREQAVALLDRANREWQRGDAETAVKLFEEIPKQRFGFSDIDDTDLKESLSLHKQFNSELSNLRDEVGKVFNGWMQQYRPKNWKALASRLHDFRDRSSVLPKPIVETFNLTELENTISTGLAKAEKAEAKVEKLQRKRTRRHLFLFSSVMFSLILFLIYRLMFAPWFAERQRTEPARLAMEKMKLFIGKSITVPSANIKILWVAPGTFEMGSSSGSSDETPHTVTLTIGYWLGKHEITQAQWQEVMGSNPSWFKGANRPVEQVSWTEVTSFCERLTELERKAGRLPAGMAYQLPTEAQWEYACRAETTTAFSFGDELTANDANFGNVDKTTDVGKYSANAWGFYDMHGNVREWCADWYGHYPRGAVSDPVGPADGSTRITRGGSWSHTRYNARSAYRRGFGHTFSFSNLGFRISLRPASQ
jgi:formylglycine-generating enzyme